MVNEHKNQKRGKKAGSLHVANSIFDILLGGVLIAGILIAGGVFALFCCASKMFKGKNR